MSILAKSKLHFCFCLFVSALVVATFCYGFITLISFADNKILVYFAINLFFAVAVSFFGGSTQTKLILLFIIIALPYLGTAITFYAFIGKISDFQFKNKQEKFTLTDSSEKDNSNLVETAQKIPDKIQKVGLYACKLFKTVPVTVQKKEYFDMPEDLWRDFLNELSNAKSQIFVFAYIFKTGKAQADFVKILFELLERGVKVTVGADYYGSGDFRKSDIFRELKKRGAKFTVYNKPWLMLFPSDNSRSHAKYALIDGQILYLSSMNIADDEIFTDKNCGIKLVGEDYLKLSDIFLPVFQNRRPKKSKISPPDISGIEKPFYIPALSLGKGSVTALYLSLLSVSEKSVDIVTPYLSLDDKTFSLIKNLIATGVRVRVAVPGKNARHDYITDVYAKQLALSGAEVYLYGGNFLHSKMLIVDGKTAVTGSTNFDIRSGRYALESLLLVCDNGLIGGLMHDFDNILLSSTMLKTKRAKKGSAITLKLIKLFAPLV